MTRAAVIRLAAPRWSFSPHSEGHQREYRRDDDASNLPDHGIEIRCQFGSRKLKLFLNQFGDVLQDVANGMAQSRVSKISRHW